MNGAMEKLKYGVFTASCWKDEAPEADTRLVFYNAALNKNLVCRNICLTEVNKHPLVPQRLLNKKYYKGKIYFGFGEIAFFIHIFVS